MKIKRHTIALPEDMHQSLKMLAASVGLTMTEILIEKIKEVLREYKASEKLKVK